MISKITPASDDFPELEWEQDALMYSEDKSNIHLMLSEKDGISYSAGGEYSCGELVEIREIEESLLQRHI